MSLFNGLTLTILLLASSEGLEDQHRKSGHKKPGLKRGSAGITYVPGLFSELFNVAQAGRLK